MFEQSYADKRKCVRLDLRSKVNFNIIETDNDGSAVKRFRAVGKNIGAEGMLLTAEESLSPGTILDLEVFFPEKPNPVYIKGEVRWCLPISEEPGKFDLGVKFRNVDKNSAFLLVEYVCGHLGKEILKRLNPHDTND